MKFILFIYMSMSYNQAVIHSIEFNSIDACLNAKTYLRTELTDHFNYSPSTLYMRCLEKE